MRTLSSRPGSYGRPRRRLRLRRTRSRGAAGGYGADDRRRISSSRGTAPSWTTARAAALPRRRPGVVPTAVRRRPARGLGLERGRGRRVRLRHDLGRLPRRRHVRRRGLHRVTRSAPLTARRSTRRGDRDFTTPCPEPDGWLGRRGSRQGFRRGFRRGRNGRSGAPGLRRALGRLRRGPAARGAGRAGDRQAIRSSRS